MKIFFSKLERANLFCPKYIHCAWQVPLKRIQTTKTCCEKISRWSLNCITTASRPTKVYGWKFTHHGWISNHYLENQPLVGKPTTLWLEILPPSQPHRCLSPIGSGGKAQLGCIVLSLIFTYLQALFWKYHPDVINHIIVKIKYKKLGIVAQWACTSVYLAFRDLNNN